MPDDIELLEKPVSPIGRTTIWLLFLLLGSLLVYMFIGKLDIVATARGAVKPKGDVQLIQMPKTGIINQLLVEEGQLVKKDQLLFSVDDTTLAVDATSYKELVVRAKLEKSALTALLKNEALDKFITSEEMEAYPEIKNYYESVTVNQGTTKERLLNQKEQMTASIDILQTEKQTIASNMNEATTQLNLLEEKKQLGSVQAEIAGLKQQVERLQKEEETYRIAITEEKMTESLWQSKVSEREKTENQLAIKEESLEEQQLELSSQQSSLKTELVNLNSQLSAKSKGIEIASKQAEEIELKIKGVTTTDNEELSSLILEKDKQLKEYETLVEKGEELLRGEKILSPIEGTVTQIMAEEIGLTLQQSQKVMAVVPKEADLYIEAHVRNQDIGFIELNQEVSVKVDSFSFQKYGLLEGKVTSISPTSTLKEDVGNVYKVQVQLNKQQSKFKNKEAILIPGMEVTAEIQTGKRRIIEFFLEPLVKYLDESLKLR